MTIGKYAYRHEPERAEALMRALIPDATARRAVAELLCEAVSAAHDAAPNSWVLRADPAQIFLNVGQVAVVMVSRDTLALVTTQLDRRPGNLTHFHSLKGKSVYAAVRTPSSHLELSHKAVAALSADVRKHLRAFIRAAAADKSRSPWKHAHSPAVLESLARAARIEVAQPAYWGHDLEHKDELVSPDGLSRDLASMREVEQAAVSHVTEAYRRAGWSVVSREAEKVGYDLECRRRGETRHVEVKGRSGEGSKVILTSGEWDRAKRDSRWVLAVVSFATSKKKVLVEYSGAQVRASVDVSPIAFRVTLT